MVQLRSSRAFRTNDTAAHGISRIRSPHPWKHALGISLFIEPLHGCRRFQAGIRFCHVGPYNQHALGMTNSTSAIRSLVPRLGETLRWQNVDDLL